MECKWACLEHNRGILLKSIIGSGLQPTTQHYKRTSTLGEGPLQLTQSQQKTWMIPVTK